MAADFWFLTSKDFTACKKATNIEEVDFKLQEVLPKQSYELSETRPLHLQPACNPTGKLI